MSSSVMPYEDMVVLTAKQLKVIYRIIGWVAVNMMHNLLGSQVSSNVRFHYDTMLQRILDIAGDHRWVRVIFRNNYHDVSVLPSVLTTSLPSRGVFSTSPEHWISLPGKALAEHWIFITRDIPMIGRVLVCEIAECYSAAHRTKLLVGLTRISGYFFSALGTCQDAHCLSFSLPGASGRAKLLIDRWERVVFLTAVVANSSDHNCFPFLNILSRGRRICNAQ